MESASEKAMQGFIVNAPDEFLTKREAALRKIEPNALQISRELFPAEFHSKISGAHTFDEWFFALTDLQREQFVDDSWNGDPGMLLRPVGNYMEQQTKESSDKSKLIRTIRSIVGGNQTKVPYEESGSMQPPGDAAEWPFGLDIDDELKMVSRSDVGRQQAVTVTIDDQRQWTLFMAALTCWRKYSQPLTTEAYYQACADLGCGTATSREAGSVAAKLRDKLKTIGLDFRRRTFSELREK